MLSEEKIMERVYETVLILRPDLSAEEGEGVVKKISQKIKDGGGEIFPVGCGWKIESSPMF